MKATLVLLVITSLMTGVYAVDTSMPFDLTTTLGEKFKNCRITKVTPEGLTIVHDRGVAKLSFALLGDELKEQFNYDPAAAREYALAEQEKREAAEEKRAALERSRKIREEEQLAALAIAERKRLDADARAVKENQDTVAAANSPATPLAPLPGDPTPNLNSLIPQQPIMQTEVIVPTVTPVGDPYTPSRIRSQTYVYPGGFYGGYPYGYYPYQPVYGYPNSGYPVTPCPSSSIIPGVRGSISSGSITIHVGH